MIGSSAIPNFPISILCRACGFNNHQLKRQFLFGLIGGIHAPAQPADGFFHRMHDHLLWRLGKLQRRAKVALLPPAFFPLLWRKLFGWRAKRYFKRLCLLWQVARTPLSLHFWDCLLDVVLKTD